MDKGLRFVLIGKKAAGKASAASYLSKRYMFKRMKIDDGIRKFIRYMYMYRSNQRIPWETRMKLYDATYKIDPNMHIDYLLHRLSKSTRDLVVEDVRYIHELKALIEDGFTVIRITTADKYKTTIPRMVHMAPESIKAYEYYGAEIEAYPVHYSIYAENVEKLHLNLDKIVDKERAKLLLIPSKDENTSTIEGGSTLEEKERTSN